MPSLRLSLKLFLVAVLLAFSPSLAATSRVRSHMIMSTAAAAHPSRLHPVVIVHVGTVQGFAHRHIAGARLLPFADLVTERDGIPNELPSLSTLERTFTRLGVGNRGTIVLYGEETLWTTRAWFTLDYLGHGHRAAILDGGLEKWDSEQLPVASGASAAPEPQPFLSRVDATAVIRRERLAPLLERQSAFGVDAVTLIDARTPAAYLGEISAADILRPGHIPGAVNAYWRENFVESPYRLFRSTKELDELYTSLGVRPGHTTVVYCRTGMEATVSYFVLKYLGYQVSLYDGSFSEWSRNPDAMIASGD